MRSTIKYLGEHKSPGPSSQISDDGSHPNSSRKSKLTAGIRSLSSSSLNRLRSLWGTNDLDTSKYSKLHEPELWMDEEEFMMLSLLTSNFSGYLWRKKRGSHSVWKKIPDYYQLRGSILLQFRPNYGFGRMKKTNSYVLHRIIDLRICHVRRLNNEDPILSVTQILHAQETQVLFRAVDTYTVTSWLNAINSSFSPVSLSHFTPLSKIGAGEWGNVFVASRGNEIFAVKEIAVLATSNVAHLVQERIVLSRISKHPFIVSLHSALRKGNHVYLVMDFAPGGDMFTAFQRKRPTKGEVVLYAAEILSALEHLHKFSIVYRDLKPENILIGADGHLLLADMGLAKVLKDGEWAKTFCGTESYLAPEIISRIPYKMTVDFWQYGCFVYELFCGRSPFWKPRNLRTNLYEIILQGAYKMPDSIPSKAKILIKDLLIVNTALRAGCNVDGWSSIKEYEFFRKTNFQKLYHNALQQKPEVDLKSLRFYLRNFDSCFTSTPVEWTSENDSSEQLFQNQLTGFEF